jgi:uncharacterized protein (DUF1501 family)
MALTNRTDCEGFYRRDFLKLGTAGLLGLTLPQALRSEARARASVADDLPRPKAKSVIMVWLGGGPASIDMWDLKPEAPDGIRGEFKPLKTNVTGVEISEHLPQMAAVADKYTIVRSICHTIPSHGLGTIHMTTGNKATPALNYPSLGSLAAKLLPGTAGIPANISFGDVRGGTGISAGYLGTAYNPFLVEGNLNPGKGGGKAAGARVRGITLPTGFTQEELEDRDQLMRVFDRGFSQVDQANDLVDGLDSFHAQALDILRSDRTRSAFNLTVESQTLRDRYGATPFGQAALAARRLVEAGVRFVTLSLGGWDTHAKNFEALSKRQLPQLDQTLSALIQDLSTRGLLDSTIVYCAGEFGRTPKVNKNAGRDHWARSMSVVLAGGGFKGGYVHGSTDAQGMAPGSEPCTPDDVAATIFKNLGVDAHLELPTPTGRKVQLFHEGHVIDRLLA